VNLDHCLHNGRAGRQILRLLRGAGLRGAAVRLLADGHDNLDVA
jgi:hypothetical protein